MKQETKFTAHGLAVTLLACLLQGSQYISNNAWNYTYAAAYESWGLTLIQIGAMASACQLAKSITNFFGGVLIEKFGYKKVLLICAATFALIPIATIFFYKSYTALMIIRILAGAAACAIYAGCNLMAFENLPPQNRAFAHGLILAGPNVGIVLASFIIPGLIQSKGWQAGCWAAGAIIMLIVIAFAILVKDGGKPENSQKKEKASDYTKNVLKACFANKNWILGTIANFLIVGTVMGLGTYLVLYLTEEKGLTLVQAGAITGATSLVGFFINPLCGVLSDAIHSRKLVTIPSAFLYAFSMIGFTLFNSMGALIAMMFIKDSTFLSATRPLNVMVAESTPAEYVASTSGIYNAISFFGSSFTPIIFGAVLLKTGTYSSMLYTAAALFALAGLVQLLMKETYTGKALESKEAAAEK